MNLPIWAMAALFVGTAMTVWLLVSSLERRSDLRRRFRALSRSQPVTGEAHPVVPIDAPRWVESVQRYAEPLASLSMPEQDEEISALRRRLRHAGWRAPSALQAFVAARTLLAVMLPALAWIGIQAAPGEGPTIAMQSLGMLVAAAIGYLAPGVWLTMRVGRRQRDIFEAFPDALDLMLVCVEAGLGLDLAIQRVAADIRLRSPALALELELVSADVRAGSTRERALQRLTERIGLDEVTGFSALLTQADRFGTSIGDALRVQADSLRSTRRLRAQEAAAKVPVKLMLPLVFCIFPAMFTVLLGPAAIRIWRVLVPALQSAS